MRGHGKGSSLKARPTILGQKNAIEPLLAEELEVLKGPAALLYGGTAIGGAVNVIDRRVPPAIPKSGLEGAFSTRYNSVF
jgi:iron complex outermembrane receptor protein